MRDRLSEKHRSDLGAVSRCVGLVLSGTARSRYVFDGEPTEDDFGELELRFADGPTVTLYLAPDAESVRADVRQLRLPEPFDIDEPGGGRCEWERVDLATEPPWAALIDHRVAAVDAVIDGRDGSPGYDFLSGWRFRFDPKGSFLYFNNGDYAAVKWSGFPEHWKAEPCGLCRSLRRRGAAEPGAAARQHAVPRAASGARGVFCASFDLLSACCV